MDATITCKMILDNLKIVDIELKTTVCAWGYLAVTRLPEPPWVSKLFLHFLTKLGRPFT